MVIGCWNAQFFKNARKKTTVNREIDFIPRKQRFLR